MRFEILIYAMDMTLQNKSQMSNVKGQRPFRNAFSLMELMIVIAIIGIMTGIGLVSLNSSKTTRALENASREVAAAIREAQNNALTGRQPNIATQTSCGHGFYFISTAGCPSNNCTKYFIYDNNYVYDAAADPPNSCVSPAETEYDSVESNKSAQYTLKDGVVFAEGNQDIYFAMPHAVATSNFDPFPVAIHLEKNSKDSYVCVYFDGNVVENGSLATCP